MQLLIYELCDVSPP